MKNLLPWHWALIQTCLFLLTCCTTVLAGAELVSGQSWLGGLSWDQWTLGVPYAIAFLGFLSCHEFGHYFMARYHQVRTTLPFYIPMFIPGIFNIGSMGAVIALQQVPRNNREYFDIGIAGPLAGMVAALLILLAGLLTLPEPATYLGQFYPEWAEIYGAIPTEAIYAQQLTAEGDAMISTGPSLLISGIWASQWVGLPPEYLLIHYPLLFAAYLALFATALNLLPIGQLDGGHIVYAMFGPKIAGIVSRIAVLGLLLVGGTGLVDLRIDGWVGALNLLAYGAFLVYVFQKILDQQPMGMVLTMSGIFLLAQGMLLFLFPDLEAQFIWLLYSLLVVRVVKLDHPPAYQFFPLDGRRKLLGWLAFLIFLLCFSPFPLRVIGLVEMDWSW